MTLLVKEGSTGLLVYHFLRGQWFEPRWFSLSYKKLVYISALCAVPAGREQIKKKTNVVPLPPYSRIQHKS